MNKVALFKRVIDRQVIKRVRTCPPWIIWRPAVLLDKSTSADLQRTGSTARRGPGPLLVPASSVEDQQIVL